MDDRAQGRAARFRPMPQDTGPYLSFAVLCEKVLRETDDVLSLIRVIDRLTVTVIAPVSTPPVSPDLAPLVSVTLAIGLKSGEFRGSLPVRVQVETPSGAEWPSFETSAEFQGEEHGPAIVLPVRSPAQDEGLYWFAIEIAGEMATRVPRVARQVVTSPLPQAD